MCKINSMKNIKGGFIIFFLILTSILMSITLSACDIYSYFYGEEKKEEEEPEDEEVCDHTWVLSTNGKKPTCKEEGYDLYICSKCREEKRSRLGKGDHEYVDNKCIYCGITQPTSTSYSQNGVTVSIYTVSANTDGSTFSLLFEGSGTMTTAPWRTKYVENVKSVVIAGADIGLPAGAFSGCVMLDDVSVTGSVSSVGEECFSGCVALRSLVFPSGIRTIGDRAFSGCKNLTEVVVPNSLTRMGKNAFTGCSRIENISLPFVGSGDKTGAGALFGSIFDNGAKNAYSQVYHAQDPAQDVYFSISDSLKTFSVTGNGSIASYAFADCSAPLPKLSLSAGIERIEEYAFYNNSGLEEAVFADGSSLNWIGDHAFDTCSALKSFDLPAGVDVINVNAFSRCRSMSEFSFAENSLVSCVKSNAFLCCSELKKLNLPTDLVVIETEAFEGCTALEELSLGEKVTSLGINAFADCSLLDVYIDSPTVADSNGNASRLFRAGNNFNLWIENGIQVSAQSYVYEKYACSNASYLTEKDGKNYVCWKIK